MTTLFKITEWVTESIRTGALNFRKQAHEPIFEHKIVLNQFQDM